MSGTTQGGQAAAQPAIATPQLSRESLERDHPALFASLQAEFKAAGAAQELARVQAVRAAALPGHEKLIETLAADGKTSGAEAAQQVLAAERSARTTAAAAHAADAPQAAKPSAAAAGAESKTRQQLADEATAYASKNNVDIVTAMKAVGVQA